MFVIRNKKRVLLASAIGTLISILLSVMLGAISLFLFDIEPPYWKLILSLSAFIPLLVAGLVTYVIFTQVMQLQQAKEQIEELSRNDFLTKTYNRGYFLDLAQKEIAVANRYQQPLTIMLIDFDKFKQINDTYGHIVGDHIIQETIRRIDHVIRESDIFGRFGGDEFVILLPHTSLDEAENLARRIQETVSATTIKSEEVEVTMTVSIGLAMLKHEHVDIDKLIQDADIALYKAKQGGRNRVCS